MKIEKNTLVEVTNEDIVDGKFIVPSGIVRIGDAAFLNCTSLQQIILPDGIEQIGYGVFNGCINLNDVKGGNRELVNQVKLQTFIGREFPKDFFNKINNLSNK